MTVYLSVVSFSEVLIAIYLELTDIPLSPSTTNLPFWLPSQFLVTVRSYLSVISIKTNHLLSVLTVTPIDRLRDGDGSNGVKGAAEEGKLCKL